MRSLSICFLLLFSSFYVNSEVKPLTVEAYGKLPAKSMFVVSPSSERIAYRDTSSGTDYVIMMELLSGKMLAAINVSSVNPNNMYFIDEDTLVFVASQNRKIRGYAGRHEISAAFAYKLTTKKMHQLLIQGNGIYKGQSQLGRILGTSPDNKYAYMPAYENAATYNLYKVRLDKKAKPRRVQGGTSDTIDFFLDGKGKVIVRERFHNKKNLHRVESKISGEWKLIYSEETEYRTKSFSGLTPDRKRLVMLGTDKKTGRWAYYTMALTDGTIEGPVFSHKDKDIETVLTDIQRVVHGVKYSGFTPSYEFFDNKLNARMRGLKKAMPNNAFSIRDYTPNWDEIIFYMDGEQSSGDYLMYKAGKLELITSERPDIPRTSVHNIEDYEYVARDGLKIPTLLTIPNGKSAKNLPAIVMPHGGPESYDKKSFNYMAQYFASQGYLVIQPQFRGSKGFGLQHLWAGRGEWGRKMQDDLTDAVVNLAEAGKIDKSRVCIVGASYGGYAALAGAVFTPDLYQCVVSINGVSDVEEMIEEEESTYGDDHWVVAYWKEVISEGDVDEDHLEQISPINHVSKIKSPVLLIHGTYDKVVPIDQSEEMFDEMEDEEKDVTFIKLKKGDHHLSKAKNRMKAMQAIDSFIKKYI
ncbi:alpha/beta hydrolase family protein [Paraglaciecola sp.]|uniref:alpha/beta hydrolase family protein n=1 Tax=Paraglaciecola sp. TaxID=1920173 RepID=UPI003EF301A2